MRMDSREGRTAGTRSGLRPKSLSLVWVVTFSGGAVAVVVAVVEVVVVVIVIAGGVFGAAGDGGLGFAGAASSSPIVTRATSSVRCGFGLVVATGSAVVVIVVEVDVLVVVVRAGTGTEGGFVSLGTVTGGSGFGFSTTPAVGGCCSCCCCGLLLFELLSCCGAGGGGSFFSVTAGARSWDMDDTRSALALGEGTVVVSPRRCRASRRASCCFCCRVLPAPRRDAPLVGRPPPAPPPSLSCPPCCCCLRVVDVVVVGVGVGPHRGEFLAEPTGVLTTTFRPGRCSNSSSSSTSPKTPPPALPIAIVVGTILRRVARGDEFGSRNTPRCGCPTLPKPTPAPVALLLLLFILLLLLF
eukprot:PhM_4_TR3424/c0_g1_i1/m.535